MKLARGADSDKFVRKRPVSRQAAQVRLSHLSPPSWRFESMLIAESPLIESALRYD